jgi:hypothetical protein
MNQMLSLVTIPPNPLMGIKKEALPAYALSG